MTRKRRGGLERARLFNLHGGKCHLCGNKINVGEGWELEHVIAWELTRDESDENVMTFGVSAKQTASRQNT